MRLPFEIICLVCLAALLGVEPGACGGRSFHHNAFGPADPRPLPPSVAETSSTPAQRLSDSTGTPSVPAEQLPGLRRVQPLKRVKVSQFQMGMMVHLTVWAPTQKRGEQACKAAFRRIREINMQMSDYEPTSELSRLCRRAGQGPVPVGRDLFQVLASARRMAEWTDGLYDPTAGPLVRLWRTARRTQTLPDRNAQRSALKLVGYQQFVIDAQRQTVQLTRPGMWLDLGSIAKGYAGDQALDTLRQQGITRAAFEAGGDKVLGDPPPGADGWSIEVPHPQTPQRELANCAVSVSGDTAQYLQIAGTRYSHVVDPRTGLGIDSGQMCIVVADHGITSDPLATVGTLMPSDEYQRLLRRHFPAVRAELLPAPRDDFHDSPRVPPPNQRR